MEQTGEKRAFALLIGCLIFGVLSSKAVEENASVEQRFAQPDSGSVPDFQKHIVPLLGKLGCSSAKCHGSFQGAGDFRLSLFGFDFQKDHFQQQRLEPKCKALCKSMHLYLERKN